LIIDKYSNLRHEPFFIRLFEILRGVEESGVKYETECIVVIDTRRSVVVVNENGTRLAILIRLPIIVYFQRNIIETIMEKINYS